MRRDRLDPVRRYRDSRAEFDPFRLLGRECHVDVDVAVDHLRVVKPCVCEAVLLGNDEVLPRVRTSWICDAEFHGRRLPRLSFHPRYRPQLSREGESAWAQKISLGRVLSARSFIPASSKVFELQVRFTLSSVRERKRVRKKEPHGATHTLMRLTPTTSILTEIGTLVSLCDGRRLRALSQAVAGLGGKRHRLAAVLHVPAQPPCHDAESRYPMEEVALY